LIDVKAPWSFKLDATPSNCIAKLKFFFIHWKIVQLARPFVVCNLSGSCWS
jgi:hypothetical protein